MEASNAALTSAWWALLIGALLIFMTLTASLLKRLPLSAGMLYLAVGYALGPGGAALLAPDLLNHAALIERLTEASLLISLFAVGLKLGVPLRDPRWFLPTRLALTSMLLTVLLVTAIAHLGLGLSLGAALVLASILAPTDPVLASDVQVEDAMDRDRLRFSLSGEGGLNDGVAFPFVMLGLAILGLHDVGGGAWRWLAIDVVWALSAGLLIGAVLGALVGKLVVYLRTHHREAVGFDEFLALGLIALAYGVSQLCAASGFLAVFAAGLALQRVEKPPSAPPGEKPLVGPAEPLQLNATMMVEAVQGFNEQLGRLVELVLVMLIGAMLSYTFVPPAAGWFIPLLFIVVRPLAVWIGLLGATVSTDQRVLISWFGIRGIGSIYYLAYAINHGLDRAIGREMVALTLTTVAASIVLHGISVTPLMALYAQRRAARRKARDISLR